jgi:hypothetical protein
LSCEKWQGKMEARKEDPSTSENVCINAWKDKNIRSNE